MKPVDFRLSGWKGWIPGHSADKADAMPTLLRRRITPLGRQALSSAWGLSETANARLILSSRHGEFSRTSSLLESVANKNNLSPADFTLSVHHALVGLLSIAHGNRRGHIAVAAGRESFCFALLEAVACLKESPDDPVVLVHFDEPLPDPFTAFNDPGEEPIALALALRAANEGEALQVKFESSSPGKKPSASHARDFLDFLAGDSIEGLSVGEHRQWCWTRHVLA